MSDNTVVTENDLTSVVEVTSAGPAGPPGGALTIQDQGVDEGLLTDKINFAGSTVSVVNDTEAEIATVTVNAADPGANTNITSLGGITGGISSPDYVQFDTAAAAAGAVGRLLWNDTDGTLEFGLKGGNVTLQIGQEQVIRVTNKAGVTMTDGQAVYITGSTGNHLNVTLAQANAEATSSKTLAVVTETIANNNTGFATSSGLVRGLDTSALAEGAAIWLSPTVPGGLTTTRPTAPDHAVLIGWCVRQHASVGVIYVHIANGYELEELHNVLITAAANNQVLRYDAATGLWKNATISPTLTLTGDVSGSATFTDLGNATLTATVADNSHAHTIENVTGLQAALDSKLLATDYNAADVLTKIKTVDGTGSGLDADLLDGQSSAYYTAINDRLGYTAENAANKGVAGGYASLDGAGLVPSTQLPSYVDDVLEFANLAAFPATGESGKIYVAVDTSKTYRWSGSTYVEISASPGSTDAVPEGSTNLYFTTARARQSISASGSLSYDNSTGVVSYTTPNTDGIAEGTTNLYYTTARARGAVSAGTGISYNSSTGVITNSAPDQTVSITGSGTTTVTGTYPNFTVSSADQYVGTVTSVSGTGTVNGLTLTGTVTSSGSLTLGGTLSVDLSTATVTGTLPVTKGGTGTTTLTSGYLVKGNGTSAVSASVVYDDGTNVGIGTSSPTEKLVLNSSGSVQVATKYINANTTGVSMGAAADGSAFVYQGSTLPFIVYTNGSERMRIDSSGNLLVGGTTAIGKITAFSAANGDILAAFRCTGTGTQRGLYVSVDNSTGVVSLDATGSAAGTLAFKYGGTEAMRIDTSGNVGIGVTPSAWLSVYRALDIGTDTSLVSQGGSTAYYFNSYRDSNGDFIYKTSAAASRYQQGDGAHYWHTAPSGTAGNAISFTQAMTLDASGNLGVGTTSGSAKLNLGGSADISIKNFANTSGFDIGMLGGSSDPGAYIYQRANSFMAFATNNTERARIDSSGNLLVGTTSTGSNTTTDGFVAQRNASGGGMVTYITNGGTGIAMAVSTQADTQAIAFFRSGTQVGSISVTTTATSYNTSSDYRLKDIDGPIVNSGAYIDALKPVQGSWKADGSRFIGLLAHEVQEVSETQIATGEKDGEEMQAMDYSAPEIIANLIAEIQSLRARVAQLEGN